MKKALLKRIERHLVDDWRRWHKWASVRWSLILLGLDALMEYLPAVREYLPDHVVRYLVIAIIVSRVLRGRGAPAKQVESP